jgi:hypothetical protein
MNPTPEEIHRRAVAIRDENLKPPTAAPCVECGTRDGYVPPGQNRPRRRDGTPWGAPGPHCDTCYRKHFGGRKFIPVADRGQDNRPRDPNPQEIRARAEAIRNEKEEAGS